MRFTPPLKIHICWRSGPGTDGACAAIARDLYEFLHRPIDDDPVQRPGLELPIEYGRDLSSLLDALDRDPGDRRYEPSVGARVVVAVLDHAAYDSRTFRDAMTRAVTRWPGRPRIDAAHAIEVLVPVILDPRWHAELPSASSDWLDSVSPLGISSDPGTRRWSLPCNVAIAAGRALLRASVDASPPMPVVLISHTKPDGEDVAKHLEGHFRTHTRIPAWYDPLDVDRGDELVRRLDAATSHGVVLVVRTDGYADSPWRDHELVAAKQARLPIVTLLAAAKGERATSAYGGNHRTMAWAPQREWEVVGRCVQAWLHDHHFKRHAEAALAHAGLPADAEIIARRPELLDLATTRTASSRRIIVYPDPPMNESEASLLRVALPSVRLVTPNTMLGRILLANDPSPPLADRSIAFSLSHAEDLPDLDDTPSGLGLTQHHLDDVLYTIVLTALYSGAQIAYGGDFRVDRGYAGKLAELHRLRRRLGTGARSQLTCYVDAVGPVDGDASIEHWPVLVPRLEEAQRFQPEVRDALWWMSMRHAMTTSTVGRIVLGGQTRAATTDEVRGYRGPWSGILEETWRCLRSGKAIYVVGGFMGFAGLIARMLIEDQMPAEPAELTSAPEAGSRLARLTLAVDDARRELAGSVDPDVLLATGDGRFAGADDLAQGVLDYWRRFRSGDASAWRNGLDVEDNLRLMRSTDRTEVSHLIFTGLRKATHRRNNDLEIALYHGDISSVSKVDAYAVTTTPGLPAVGALASLDRSMGGRLGRKVAEAASVKDVVGVDVETVTLPGRHVFAARIDLPAAGSSIAAGAVEELAATVACAADRIGAESIAAAPFAATMGLSPADAVIAMIAGLRRGRETYPRTLVVCEVDGRNHAGIRAALEARGESFRELRAGPRPAKADDTVVLQVDAAPDERHGTTRLRATAYASGSAQPVVPQSEISISAPDWSDLRSQLRGFRDAVERGRTLWRLLMPDVGGLLARNAGRRVLLLSNDHASGLPWELLAPDVGRPISVEAGVVRRIALAGQATPPADRASTDAHLRVLLIVDPQQNLRGAAAEGDVVAQALASRADVVIERIDGHGATVRRVREELEAGHYDVLHYAGHATFRPTRPQDSGLCLADGTLTAEALGRSPVPRLVVLNACVSARLRDDLSTDTHATPLADGRPLAEALLRAGVTTMLGTFFRVGDQAALMLARTLYGSLVMGHPIGHATRDACRLLHEQEVDDWGNFVLYGDDTLIL